MLGQPSQPGANRRSPGLTACGTALLLTFTGMMSLVCPDSAFAQSDADDAPTSGPRPNARARALFREGLEAADGDDWETAADRFRSSLSLRPSGVVAYNLGSALRELGQLVEATEVFRTLVEDSQTRTPVRRAAAELVAAIEPRLGSLTLEVRATDQETVPDDVDVHVANRPWPRERWGVPTPVDPGSAIVTARRGERVLARQAIDVDLGERLDVTLTVHLPPTLTEAVEVPSAAPAALSPTAVPEEETSWLESPLFWVVMGGTVATALAVVLVVFLTGEDDPVAGNTTPPVVEF